MELVKAKRTTLSSLRARQMRAQWIENGDSVNHMPELFSASERLTMLHGCVLACIVRGQAEQAGKLAKLLATRAREYAPCLEATRKAREFGAVTLLDRIYSNNVAS